MYISNSGFLFLFLFLFLVIVFKVKVFDLFIVTLPFCATSFIDIPNAKTSISISLATSIFYIISFFLNAFYKKRIGVDRKFFFLTIFFVLSITISYFLSFYKENEANFFSVIYICIGALIAYCVSRDVRNVNGSHLLNVMLYTVLITSIIGLYQCLAFYTSLSYPHEWLNNGLNPTVLGYRGALGDYKRISSILSEPSIFAQFMLAMTIPILFNNKKSLFSIIVVILSFTSILISTSTIGYIGILLLVFFRYTLFFGKKSIGEIILVVFTLILSMLLLMYLFNEIISLIDFKVSSYSYLERSTSVYDSFSKFYQYPLFGAGFYSITVHSSIFLLLANAGILGTFSYYLWMFYILKKSKSVGNEATSWVLSLVLLLSLGVISGFIFVYSFYWFIIGVAMSYAGRKV